MKRILTVISTAAVLAIAAAPRSIAAAQEKAGPTLVPLKLQLVITRQAGEKKISSLPYTLWVTANERKPTNLRMGVEVAVPTTFIPKDGVPQTSYSYRPVGTDIDCTAATAPDGMFNVNIVLSDSSVMFFSAKDAPKGEGDRPTFRNFRSNFSILLKDGQTAQYTSATDPVSGEVLKVDVTLNVLK